VASVLLPFGVEFSTLSLGEAQVQLIEQIKLRLERQKNQSSSINNLRTEFPAPKLGFLLIALSAILTAILLKLFSEIAFR
jgi:hypothetical protein